MLIRCDKCSTLYELDDKLLPAHGAPVQCSKCQFVFKAYPSPPDEPAQAEVGETAAEPVAPPVEPPAGSDGWVREGGALVNPALMTNVSHETASSRRPPPVRSSPPAPPQSQEPRSIPAPGAPSHAAQRGSASPDEPKFTADGRPIRKVPFPTSEPSYTGPRAPPVRPPPAPRLKLTQLPPRWVIVAVVLVALAIVGALAWWASQGRTSGPKRGAIDAPSRTAAPSGTPEPPARK